MPDVQNNAFVYQDPEDSHRRFSGIIDAAIPFFRTASVNRARHVASGLLIPANGNAHRCCLSYDDLARVVTLRIVLPPAQLRSAQQWAMLLRLQAATQAARFTFQSPDDPLVLEAGSFGIEPGNARVVLTALTANLGRVLGDDRLRVVMDQ